MDDTLPVDVIEEAIMAFDAANHAWGRFRHFVLSGSPAAQAVSTAGVREALQEAAVSVPDAQAGDPFPLRAAVRAAATELKTYVTSLPEELQRSELNEALEALDEAQVLLGALDAE